MRQITVVVHRENGSWWAESDDLPGFSALAPDLDTLRAELAAGVSFELDDAPFRIIERDESGAALTAGSVFAPSALRWWTETTESKSPIADLYSRMGAAHVAHAGVPA